MVMLKEAKVCHLATSRPSNTGRQGHPHLHYQTVQLAHSQTIKLSNFLAFSNKRRFPFGVPCIMPARCKSMEKRLPVALRAVALLKSAKKGRRELIVASALAFGETRRIKRTETRRDFGKYRRKGLQPICVR